MSAMTVQSGRAGAGRGPMAGLLGRHLKWIVLSLLWLGAGRPAGAIQAAALQSSNLLRNPSFEGEFFAWSGINEIQVAHEWTPWWMEDSGREPPYFRPEYKRALVHVYPRRVLEGDSAQQYFTFHASHLAGMYQQVFNAVPGQRYRFTIWAQVWSSMEDNPDLSVLPANPRLHVGIDPSGNWRAGAATVVWSAEAPMSIHIDRWGAISVEAVAQSSTVTVFMRTSPDFANKHNDIYWDLASLAPVAPPPPPAPLPSSTAPPPPPATNTPAVTATVAPTNTRPTTDTASPTATATPEPATHTPTATTVASVTSTALPSPSATRPPTSPTAAATEIAAGPTEPAVTPAPTAGPSQPEPAAVAAPMLLLGATGLVVLVALGALGVALFRRRA